MKLALVQFNPVIGDLSGNAGRILDRIREAEAAQADLIVVPELALTGYPPRDLLLQQGFCDSVRRVALELVGRCDGKGTIALGLPWKPEAGGGPTSWDDRAGSTNSVMIIRRGTVEARYDKRLLPTYDVFDEDRYFIPGDRPLVIEVAGVPVGISICEDLWKGSDVGATDRYAGRADPVADLVAEGARVIVSLSASPFVLGKGQRQRDILTRHVQTHGVAVAAVNQVGGNDDLIFDGHAAAYIPVSNGREARLIAAGPGFQEAVVMVEIPSDPAAWASLPAKSDPLLAASEESLLWRALVLGVRDYCAKTGFRSCVLGLSGGIDSALTACIAAAALGADRVLGVGLPSRYSSEGSVSDAKELADRLGIRWSMLPIDPVHRAVEGIIEPLFEKIAPGKPPDVTEENVQSRLRGLLLMAISNKTGAILLTTGNKSESAVGYCTLYGDMNGGLAVLSDVTKQDVYRLSRWLNEHAREAGLGMTSGIGPIPGASITKPPSAELRPNQTDQDSLPSYELLDDVIERYVEGRQSATAISRDTGYDPAVVQRIIRLINLSEYKRKQMATGLKVTTSTFGPGRRWPIAHGYRE